MGPPQEQHEGQSASSSSQPQPSLEPGVDTKSTMILSTSWFTPKRSFFNFYFLVNRSVLKKKNVGKGREFFIFFLCGYVIGRRTKTGFFFFSCHFLLIKRKRLFSFLDEYLRCCYFPFFNVGHGFELLGVVLFMLDQCRCILN